MASIEERFQAAVNVIKGLPKNGPYQPSTAMMLKFYGYYKQATEGACHQKRPGFWDVVGKAKWDAWNDNRHLTKQQAMERYVLNLREIIETMSFTENVQNFVGSISGLDNINLDELDMVAPGMRELAESHPNSPFNSRTNSPRHGASVNNSSGEEDDAPTTSAQMNGHANLQNPYEHNKTLTNGTANRIEEIAATSEQVQQTSTVAMLSNGYATSNGTVDHSDDEYGDPVDMNQEINDAVQRHAQMLRNIQTIVIQLNEDVNTVQRRMENLERLISDLRVIILQQANQRAGHRYPAWWPFKNISPLWFALLMLWPIVVGSMTRVLAAQRRK